MNERLDPHAGGQPRGDSRGSAESNAALFAISVAAELAGMHAQTLRTYDRLGLVTPHRTTGGGRRYSQRDVELLREVQRLSQEEGVNLAGIKRIIELTNQVEALQSRLTELMDEVARLRQRRGELVPLPRSQALVVWKRRHQ
ncbi:heat shock protein transcriptional repressor HspR [Hoyosella altamirensis]|uniref:MerR family transcriptional regulator/heat shock protein HspR n=1 Tax=Hoyosella altamirensis TaxID=616997 RepID=A0A839RTD5_9ACTN|nr:helix-turn-helix transcriptional regulator [Hoyosella altamirensis]MBB3039619.1 MerR family transcriptional regulator/heat shock protein HspR [Hoyosella altamirensis]